MKKLLYLIIAGALIFGCISDIFATTYKQMGKVYPQGNFSSDCFTLITNTTLASNTTSVTISNLVGNTTVEYGLGYRIVNGYNGTTNIGLQFSNDTGSNYGKQYLYGTSTTVTAGRTTGDAYNQLATPIALNDISQGFAVIHGNAGYIRTNLDEQVFNAVTTTVGYVALYGQVWNNTASQVTDMTIVSSQANGLGIGSYIALWGKEYKQ